MLIFTHGFLVLYSDCLKTGLVHIWDNWVASSFQTPFGPNCLKSKLCELGLFVSLTTFYMCYKTAYSSVWFTSFWVSESELVSVRILDIFRFQRSTFQTKFIPDTNCTTKANIFKKWLMFLFKVVQGKDKKREVRSAFLEAWIILRDVWKSDLSSFRKPLLLNPHMFENRKNKLEPQLYVRTVNVRNSYHSKS